MWVRIDAHSIVSNYYGNLTEALFSYQEAEIPVTNTYMLIAVEILKRSQLYVPIKTGELKNSAYLKNRDGYSEIGYSANYAVHVHEIESNQHKYPTRHKFLEDAALEVWNETPKQLKIGIRIGIIYNPLRLFIGTAENLPGENLFKIQKNFKAMNTPEFEDKIRQFWMSYNPTTATPAERSTYEFMSRYIEWYAGVRNQGINTVFDHMKRRMRHSMYDW